MDEQTKKLLEGNKDDSSGGAKEGGTGAESTDVVKEGATDTSTDTSTDTTKKDETGGINSGETKQP